MLLVVYLRYFAGRSCVKLKLLPWRNAFWVLMVMLGFKLGTVRSGRRERGRKVEPEAGLQEEKEV